MGGARADARKRVRNQRVIEQDLGDYSATRGQGVGRMEGTTIALTDGPPNQDPRIIVLYTLRKEKNKNTARTIDIFIEFD